MQKGLFRVLMKRRRLHKVFDLMRCEGRLSLIEKAGFAAEKNLILKDCYLSLDQLRGLKDPSLEHRIEDMTRILESHLSANDCPSGCNPGEWVTCSVCLDHNTRFRKYEVDKATQCSRCGVRAHNGCVKSHNCPK